MDGVGQMYATGTEEGYVGDSRAHKLSKVASPANCMPGQNEGPEPSDLISQEKRALDF